MTYQFRLEIEQRELFLVEKLLREYCETESIQLKISSVTGENPLSLEIQLDNLTGVKLFKFKEFLGDNFLEPLPLKNIAKLTKICNKCLKEKELDKFIQRKNCKDGIGNICYECFRAGQKEYYNNNREASKRRTYANRAKKRLDSKNNKE